MACLNSKSLIIVLQLQISLFFLSCCTLSYADTNSFLGSLCSTPSEPEDPSWTANLNAVFRSIESSVNQDNGFSKAEAGERSVKAYGLIQCRGDVPPSDCGECSRESFNLAKNCSGSKTVVIWQNWCFLRYSNESFYGVWDKTNAGLPKGEGTDEPRVAGKGRAMMAGLAAAAPRERLMFAKSEMDDGKGGKRYGLAQCSRDLKKSSCEDCLQYLIKNIGRSSSMANRSAWDVYAVGCFMWYDHSHFYFNATTPQSPRSVRRKNSANRYWAGCFVMGLPVFATTAYILVNMDSFS